MIDIPINQFESYLTEYISTAWCKEDFKIKSLKFDDSGIYSVIIPIIVHEPYCFSAIQTTIWIEKLAWAYYMWYNKLDKIPGEGFVRNINIEYKNKIMEREVNIIMKIKKTINNSKWQYTTFDVDIQNGSFIGICKIVFPLDNKHQFKNKL